VCAHYCTSLRLPLSDLPVLRSQNRCPLRSPCDNLQVRQRPRSQAGTGSLDGFHLFPCSLTLTISLTFGQIAFPIQRVASLVLFSSSHGACLSCPTPCSPPTFSTFNLGQVDDDLCRSPFFSISSLASSEGSSFPQWIINRWRFVHLVSPCLL
jgi:hypothetical protein